MLSATLNTPVIPFFRGEMTVVSVYPGKNRINGSPKTMRAVLDGKKLINKIKMTDNITIPNRKRLLPILIFTDITPGWLIISSIAVCDPVSKTNDTNSDRVRIGTN